MAVFHDVNNVVDLGNLCGRNNLDDLNDLDNLNDLDDLNNLDSAWRFDHTIQTTWSFGRLSPSRLVRFVAHRDTTARLFTSYF